MKEKAYLIGPFIGELYWEAYRFAPYIIHLKKEDPSVKIIVFTRPSRFDLYGRYADLFVPLNIKGDKTFEKSGFGLIGFNKDDYKVITRYFNKKYRKRFEIVDRIFPSIDSFMHKVKWQFPRNKMDYNFFPRKENEEIVNEFLLEVDNNKPLIYIDINDGWLPPFQYLFDIKEKYEIINSNFFIETILPKIDNIRSTYVGCLIELFKHIKFVYGNMNNFPSKLSLLIGTPVLIDKPITYDKLSLINPLSTMVIDTGVDILEGVKIYENNI